MGWMIAITVIVLLAFLPLGFRAVYMDGGPSLWILIGPMKLRVFPSGTGKKKSTVKRKKQPKASLTTKNTETQKRMVKGGNYRDFLPITQTIINFLSHFRRKIRVNNLELKVLLAGGDPCELAVNYGKAWAALGNLMPQLERIFIIKKRNLEVECDFCGDKTIILARLDATITLGRTVHLLTVHGLKILKQLLQLRKLREGGANI